MISKRIVTVSFILGLFWGCADKTETREKADENPGDSSSSTASTNYLGVIAKDWTARAATQELPQTPLAQTLDDWRDQKVDILDVIDGEKATVMIFMAPTCPYSKAYMDMISSRYDILTENLEFVFISLSTKDDLTFYLEKIDYPWDFLLDPTEAYARSYGYRENVPYSIFINKNKRILGSMEGYEKVNERAFLRLFDQVSNDDQS